MEVHSMRARDRGRAYGQIVALGAALAVFCTAAPWTAAPTSAVSALVRAVGLISTDHTGSGHCRTRCSCVIRTLARDRC
jgi:hypothetical protein